MLNHKTSWVWAAFSLTLLGACGSTAPSAPDGLDDEDESAASADPSEDDDSTSTGTKTGTGTSTKTGSGTSSGGSTSRDAGTGSSGGSKADGIPCEVNKIVQKSCGTCHGAKPVGAPFSLATLSDFQGKHPLDASRQMAAAAAASVKATDPKKRMPPASATALTAAEIKTLSSWLEGGAKAGAACAAEGGSTDSDTGAEGGEGGEPGASSGSGGASSKPITYTDPDVKCYKLTAYGTPADKTQKYSVPTTPDLYTAFNVKAPWTGTQYIKSFRSVIDNGPVLHHWLLFRQLNGGNEVIIPNALGAHPDGEMLYGWAPGGDDMWFDEDVGMEVPANSVFQLEMHYNNRTGRASPDASGVEVCVTPKKPAHIAGLSWVGTDAINGTRAVGNCTHASREKIRLIASQPHMHTKGTHMKVDLTRAGGARETIHDKPFDFNFQRAYIHNIDIMPGDKLTTTCTYSAPARFGKGTSDEMCYFFSIHWPRGALSRTSFSSIIHGPNTCID